MTALLIDLIYRLKLERLERNVLGGDEQLAAKSTFGGTTAERFFRGEARKIGIIVFLRKMRKDKIPRAAVKSFRIAKIFADGMIREMPGAREDALLDDPRIRPDFEHIQVVIRFQQQTIRVAQMNFDELRHVAKIGDERHLRAVGAKGEADRISRVVRNLKRVNINIANHEVLTGLNGFHATQALREPVGQRPVQRLHRLFRNVERRFPQTQHLRKTVAMIEVLVSNEDAVDVVDTKFDGC